MEYEVLDHTADLLIRGYGKDIAGCYESVAYGMFDQTVDLSGVSPVERRHVEVEGEDPEDALYSFLAELLFIENYDNLIMCEFSVSVDGNRISCDCAGELLDRDRMHIRGEIKAVTFHMMEIDASVPQVTVLFDVRRPQRTFPCRCYPYIGHTHTPGHAQTRLVLHRKGPRLPQPPEGRHGR